jgi:OmpA-OmpF porin, OOP family
MKSIKLLMATAMLAIGSTAAMAQASYTANSGIILWI